MHQVQGNVESQPAQRRAPQELETHAHASLGGSAPQATRNRERHDARQQRKHGQQDGARDQVRLRAKGRTSLAKVRAVHSDQSVPQHQSQRDLKQHLYGTKQRTWQKLHQPFRGPRPTTSCSGKLRHHIASTTLPCSNVAAAPTSCSASHTRTANVKECHSLAEARHRTIRVDCYFAHLARILERRSRVLLLPLLLDNTAQYSRTALVRRRDFAAHLLLSC